MMWKFIKKRHFSLNLAFLTLVFLSCNHGLKNKKEFSLHPSGYYYRLLSFNADSACQQAGQIARVAATFRTQSDSIFWDSHNNLNDNLFMSTDPGAGLNFFRSHVAGSCVSDSVCLLVKPKYFFQQQFKSDSVPFFSKTDSIIKINFRITELLSEIQFENLRDNLEKKELAEIRNFFTTGAETEAALDPLGFYWIVKPAGVNSSAVEGGDLVTLSYEGRFLNGRFFERSTGYFDFVFGTPDQLLKGLNNVIGQLKLGQTAKILLPSRLAFGESGSSNGIVPPYTPLIYEVKIIDIKKTK
ncbi:MAG: FKBP-type peptidyl-prolyl cis-trans isomerase [Bacteroidota bacterium]